jgi:1,4-alpha-glucan branching enzyme
VRVVKFVITAPQANSVSIIGDFNGWDAKATSATRTQDGTWEMFVPLRPGRYEYSFVLDGTHLIPDPAAPVAPDDGYGQKNSVVVVAGAAS